MESLKTPFHRAFHAIVILALMGSVGCSEIRALKALFFSDNASLLQSEFEFDELKSGDRLTCALMGNKTLRCVGTNEQNNLGSPQGGYVNLPGKVKRIALGTEFTCFTLEANEQLFCMGRNDRGQLGNGSGGHSARPVPVLDSENNNAPVNEVKDLVAGDSHACALLKSNRIICWGAFEAGQRGNPSNEKYGTYTVQESPKALRAMSGVKGLAAGGNGTCVIAKEDASVYCFGDFGYGIPEANTKWIPKKIELSNGSGNLSGVKQIGMGQGFGCALTRGAQVFCFGKNDKNQLGILKLTQGSDRASLVQVTYPQEMALSKIESIAVGASHACALHRDEHTVYCWGNNLYHQLGSTSVRGSPEQVALGPNNLTLKEVKELAAGPDRTCITSYRDEMFCWGNGDSGLLASGKNNSIYPLRALDRNREGFTGVVKVSLGNRHSCFIDQLERLYCFGVNAFGEMGLQGVAPPVLQDEVRVLDKVLTLDTYKNRTCVVFGEQQRVACFGGVDGPPGLEPLKEGTDEFQGITGLALGETKISLITKEQLVSVIPIQSEVGGAAKQIVMDSTGKRLKDIWQLRTKLGLACGLNQEVGSIWCWDESESAEQIPSRAIQDASGVAKEFIQISVSENEVCGIRGKSRELWCAPRVGENRNVSQLKVMMNEAGQAIQGVTSLSGGKDHHCVVNEKSQIFCWGRNDHLQLGQKAIGSYPSPIEIKNLPNELKEIVSVTAGDRHTCFTVSGKGALYCFGEIFYGGALSSIPIEYPL